MDADLSLCRAQCTQMGKLGLDCSSGHVSKTTPYGAADVILMEMWTPHCVSDSCLGIGVAFAVRDVVDEVISILPHSL